MTYASDWLLETSARHCGHPFAAIPLLQNQQLLFLLKAKVMIEPTELMAKATGVPPHVMHVILLTLLQAHQGLVRPQNPHSGACAEQIGGGNQVSTLYLLYSGRFWDAPQSILFPVGIKRDVGWKLWLAWMPAYRTEGKNGAVINNAIKPFRKFIPTRLPKKIANFYKFYWQHLSM